MNTVDEQIRSQSREIELSVSDQLFRLNSLSKNREQSEACFGATQSFLKKLKEKDPSLSEGVEKAIEFLVKFDRDTSKNLPNSRNSGELSVYHPILVTKMLFERFGIIDLKVLQAAILHDVIEDVMEGKGLYFWSGGKPEGVWLEITNLFGNDVREMVNGLTKLKDKGKVDDKKTYEEVFGAAINFPGVLFIKLADRLHNWETIGSMSLKKKAEAIKETREFFGVIAKYLGLTWVIDDFGNYINVALGEISQSGNANELFSTIFNKGHNEASKRWMGELLRDFDRRSDIIWASKLKNKEE